MKHSSTRTLEIVSVYSCIASQTSDTSSNTDLKSKASLEHGFFPFPGPYFLTWNNAQAQTRGLLCLRLPAVRKARQNIEWDTQTSFLAGLSRPNISLRCQWITTSRTWEILRCFVESLSRSRTRGRRIFLSFCSCRGDQDFRVHTLLYLFSSPQQQKLDAPTLHSRAHISKSGRASAEETQHPALVVDSVPEVTDPSCCLTCPRSL